MSFRRVPLSRLFLLILAASLFSPGLAFAQDPADDPDFPDFARYKVDKEEFLRLRAEAVGLRRGLANEDPADPFDRIAAIREMERQEALRDASARAGLAAPWVPLGPAPIPNGQTPVTSTPVSGRVTAIAVHPTDADIVYVGTAQGGLYRSTDGGTNWTPLMDDALSLAIGAVTIAPSAPETVYVGTGEPNFSIDSFFGVGIYRIDDASTTATLAGPFGSAEFTGRSIGQIAVHPTDPATIFVASTSGFGGIRPTSSVFPPRGIYRSTDATAGAPTFTRIGPSAPNVSVRDIALDPGDPNVLVASPIDSSLNAGGIYRSIDALAATPTFNQVVVLNSTSTSTLVTEFAVVRPPMASAATFYAASGVSGGRVQRSIDGGATWTTQVTNGFCDPQCFYDVAIAVDPTDADRVYLGGSPNLTSARSTDGAVTFTDFDIGVHVDTHAITVAPSDPTVVYLGTDGGIYKSTDGGDSYVSLNNSQFSATQFMSLALHPTDPNFTIGGTQDNGTNHLRPDGTWFRVDFGDGGWAQIDQNAADTTAVRMYHTYFNATNLQGYGTVANVADAVDGSWTFRGCQSFGATTNGITCTGPINFYAPLERGPGVPNTLYYGSDRLYRTENQGVTHLVVSQSPISSGVPISAIGIAPTNDNVRIVGLNNGALFGTSTGSSTLSNLDPTNAIPDVAIARVVVDPKRPTTAYVTLSTFAADTVWKTTDLDGGTPTWTPISTGLPRVPANAFVVDPMDSNNLFVGTDIGVFVSEDAGATWTPFGTGLPRVAVFDMAIHPVTRKLRIATHGRGMWENGGDPLPVELLSFSTE